MGDYRGRKRSKRCINMGMSDRQINKARQRIKREVREKNRNLNILNQNLSSRLYLRTNNQV